MSQFVNRGEKSAASGPAADAVEPAESAEPTEEPAASEAGNPDDTPTLNLDDESDDAADTADSTDGADSADSQDETSADTEAADAETTNAETVDAETTEEASDTSPSDTAVEPAAEGDADASVTQAIESTPSADVETVPGTMPTIRLTSSLSRPAAEPSAGARAEAGAESVSTPPQQPRADTADDESVEVDEHAESAEVEESAVPVQGDEPAVPAEANESVENVEPEAVASEAASAEPASDEPVAAEAVATPAAISAVDEGATPAEAAVPSEVPSEPPHDVPGDSSHDPAGTDMASQPSASAEAGGHAPWNPDSGTMPPSVTPKTPASAGAAATETADEASSQASSGPAEVDVEPVIRAAFPAAPPESVNAAATAEKAVDKTADKAAVATEQKTDNAAGWRSASRRRRLIPAACAAGAAAFLLAWGGIAWWTTQHIASGTSISGVDVSGLSPKQAEDRLSKGVGDQLAQPVTLTVGQGSSELVPASSGVSVDAKASVKKLTGFTLNPVTLAQRLGGQRTDAVIRVDAPALRGALEDRVDTMANGAVSATVTLEGTEPVTTPASNGVGLDVEASLKQLNGSWPLGQKTIAMAEGTAIPAITDAEATKFVDGTLKPLLASGLTVDGAGAGASGKSAGAAAAAFSPEDTAGMLKISSDGGTLSATFDQTALHDGVVARIGQVETPAQNATWKIDGSGAGAPGARPQYVAASQGKIIDTAALSASLLKAGTSATDAAGRTVPLPMVVAEPTVTTPQNEWGIAEPVGEYATPYNSGDAPRTQNLTRGAELINGTVVKPGEVFSLEKALGEVDYEHGFADAGVISNGQHVDSMGGGLSQVATTVFNAGFEAGMDDTEHHAHQYYFDRYPAGREATLWTGKLDVKFTNSTSHAVLVQAWLDGEQIHVRLWSTKYYDVSITSSDRFNFRPVSTERKSGPGCEPYSGGNPGFDITVTRTRKHDGKALPDDVLTTQYAADNDIVCS